MPKGQSLGAGILAAALEGLELQRERLEQSIAEVRRLLGGAGRKSVVAAVARKPRRRLSAAARRRISAVQKKRWADWRKKQATAAKK